MRMHHGKLIPYLCSKHLSGLHSEIHKHRPSFVKKHSIKGRISPVVQIEPDRMKIIHDLVAKRLNHKTPYELPDLSYLPKYQREARIDLKENIRVLSERCKECRENIKKGGI